MPTRHTAGAAVALAALSALAMVAEPAAAAAQEGPPPYSGYAPPAYGYGGYREQYDAWAAENCAREHSNNIAAGAIVGGVAGALMGASLAGWAARGAWALFGGSVGLVAGAAIGAGSSSPSCPHGYALRSGAPAFAYQPPASPGYAYGPASYDDAGPGWNGEQAYGPDHGGWAWNGYRWVRRPYGYGAPPAWADRPREYAPEYGQEYATEYGYARPAYAEQRAYAPDRGGWMWDGYGWVRRPYGYYAPAY